MKDRGSNENESVGDDQDDCLAVLIMWRVVVVTDEDTRLASSSLVRRRPELRDS